MVPTMRSPRLLAAAALSAGLLAAPAGALAQGSAGDNQYADPFAGGNSGGGSQGSAHPKHHGAAPVRHAAPQRTTRATPTTSAPAPAPVQAESTSAAGAATSSASADSSTASTRTLPRTGFDALPEAGLGAVMLLSGLALRARVSRVGRRRRPAGGRGS